VSQDFVAHYDEQLRFLRREAAAYDDGDEAEAKNLAHRIRMWVHDTGHVTSLLTHLGLKERMPFRDTAPAEPPAGVIAIGAGLCMFHFTMATPGTIEFRPVLDNLSEDRMHPPACFADWWQRPVLSDTHGNEFSRRDLVLGVAHQDGGAHIDATLAPKYQAISRDNSLGIGQEDTGPNSVALTITFEGLTPVPDPDAQPPSNSLALASVRQVAHELLTTLEANVTDDAGELRLREEICPIPFDEPPAVGRNDPCPCGSGRKMKQCFGRRQPRRQAQLPTTG
jgi:hypothetical protein